MSRVIILRHAKAEKLAETDHARPLSKRGLEQVRACRQWLLDLPFQVDFAIVSSSVRTMQTWQGLELSNPVLITDEAYNASAEQLVHLIRHSDHVHETVLLIAHNPGVSDLAFANGFHGELATCGAVVIEIDGTLSQFGLVDGAPAQVFTPM